MQNSTEQSDIYNWRPDQIQTCQILEEVALFRWRREGYLARTTKLAGDGSKPIQPSTWSRRHMAYGVYGYEEQELYLSLTSLIYTSIVCGLG